MPDPNNPSKITMVPGQPAAVTNAGPGEVGPVTTMIPRPPAVAPPPADPDYDHDETIPGGKYLIGAKFEGNKTVGGTLVNALGQEIDDNGKVKPGQPPPPPTI